MLKGSTRHVVNGVVGAQALPILECRRQGQLRVPEASILDRLRGARHRVGRDRVAWREGPVRNPRYAIRLAGGGALVLYVGRLFRLLAGAGLEGLGACRGNGPQ